VAERFVKGSCLVAPVATKQREEFFFNDLFRDLVV